MNKPKQRTILARWMVSFADFLSVVLAFMVLIYATGQNIQTPKNANLKEVNQESAEKTQEESSVMLDSSLSQFTPDYLSRVFAEKFKNNVSFRDIPMQTKNDRFILSFQDNFFEYEENVKNLTDALYTMKSEVRVYSKDLEKSKTVANLLLKHGFSDNLGFFQSRNSSNGIDIVIYP